VKGKKQFSAVNRREIGIGRTWRWTWGGRVTDRRTERDGVNSEWRTQRVKRYSQTATTRLSFTTAKGRAAPMRSREPAVALADPTGALSLSLGAGNRQKNLFLRSWRRERSHCATPTKLREGGKVSCCDTSAHGYNACSFRSFPLLTLPCG